MNISVISERGLSLGERLGQGSYATVYKACNKVLRKNGTREVFAIKCIAKNKICINQTAQDNMIREIEILKKLCHPNIVQLVDFLWDNDNIYLILEYCNAGDLSQFIKKRRQWEKVKSGTTTIFSLPEPVTRRFLQQLAAAMKYLRYKQISHMDLKPQNILLSMASDQKITLKLADFGFATKLRYGDTVNSMRGSPLYMAPEILKQQSYDARVDLWSIGVILFECLFGKALFVATDLDSLIAEIIKDEPIVIPNKPPLTPCCRHLLKTLLQRNPEDRLTFIEFFVHPFVDDTYCPNKECLDRAFEVLSAAEKCDRSSKPLEAFKLYCECLDYLICGLQYSKRPSGENLRNIIKQVLQKAETVKAAFTAKESTAIFPERAPCLELDTLKSLFDNAPQLEAALVLQKYAENLLKKSKGSSELENLETCLQKYELAVEAGLKLLQDFKNKENRANRIGLLRSTVEAWLSRAEELKCYLEMKRLNLSARSLEEKEREAEVSVDEKTKKIVQENLCKIQ